MLANFRYPSNRYAQNSKNVILADGGFSFIEKQHLLRFM